ncbi:sensor histidine kinase [Streptococcus porcinus]|uniref:Histidine kinase n=2 Tax=Streptococcus porcinus TaxID=1340 RepID=A0A4V0H258_STRPO|nr:histidine kinase [Streptococcus porcinus]EGJ28313.1 histidine kinase [Streptococcus porcinus str. Jelinkova 176]SQG43128.1 histidine kinase [Streptococcus porcinus]VTT42146.1 histidine kinase [Streptococcus porcinus]VTT43602.1 histidine kinase [Streptococcus porcinus]
MESDKKVAGLTFKEKLRLEILAGFKKTAWVIGLSYVLVLTLFILLVQYSQLAHGNNEIVTYFDTVHLKSNRLFSNLEKRSLNKFLSGHLSEREMYRQVYQESSRLPFRSAISIYNPKGQLLLSTRLPNRDGLRDDAFVKIALSHIKNKSEYRLMKDYQGNPFLLKMKAIWSKGIKTGYLVLYIDGNDFESGLKVDATQYVIADRFNHLFTSNSLQDTTLSWQKINSNQLKKRMSIRNGSLILHQWKPLGQELFLYTSILVLPLSYLLLFTCFFVFVIMLLLIVLARQLSERISSHSSDSVAILVEDLDLIVGGYQYKVGVRSEDEFGYLAEKINSLINTLDRLFRQMLTLEQEKSTVERKLLEAQFHPHFLYNSLESIKVLIHFNPHKAQAMILALNRVLRYSITSQAEYAVLASDFDILEDFLEVNQVRFEDFHFSLSYPDELQQLRIPKLFLLPLVENAIKYGMQYRHDLTLRVDLKMIDKHIQIYVLDNGPGFSQSFKDNFARYLKAGHTEHGLVNSYSRLAMFYPSTTIQLCQVDMLNGILLQFERKQACYE